MTLKKWIVIITVLCIFSGIYAINKIKVNQITLGDSPRTVLKIVGKPTNRQVFGNTKIWYYGLSSVTFKNNKIKEWSNLGALPVFIGKKDANAVPIEEGSTVKQVVKAMGTPTSIIVYGQGQIWYFERSSVTIKNNKVIDIIDKGHLLVKNKKESFNKKDSRSLIELGNTNTRFAPGYRKFLNRISRKQKLVIRTSQNLLANTFFNKYGKDER